MTTLPLISPARSEDFALVEQARAGDQRAFERLFAKYHRKLIRLISHYIHDAEDAEDVAQDSFFRAFRALDSFRGDSAFYTWLYRIGINNAKNWLVSRGRKPQVSKTIDAEDAENLDSAMAYHDMDTPERLLQSKQLVMTVNSAMESLPNDLREAIFLREIEGLSYDEIAEKMACPVGTVRSRIFRAREAVAETLRPLLDTAPEHRW